MVLNKEQIEELLERLEGPEGCNFREEVKGDPESIIWDCNGANGDYKLSRAILTKMGISKEKQDEFFEECVELLACCDCEIVFNISDLYLE